jgi:predicted transcriptional regulator
MTDEASLTLDLDPAIHRRLKILAASRRLSIQDICIQAIQRHVVALENPRVVGPDPVLEELWDNEEDAAAYDHIEI